MSSGWPKGPYIGSAMIAERLATHYFLCTSPGYRGWAWAVTVARVPRGKVATVCETNLVPGPDALLSPPWVPYADRLAPGDLGPGDVLPKVEDDPNLEFGFEQTLPGVADHLAWRRQGRAGLAAQDLPQRDDGRQHNDGRQHRPGHRPTG